MDPAIVEKLHDAFKVAHRGSVSRPAGQLRHGLSYMNSADYMKVVEEVTERARGGRSPRPAGRRIDEQTAGTVSGRSVRLTADSGANCQRVSRLTARSDQDRSFAQREAMAREGERAVKSATRSSGAASSGWPSAPLSSGPAALGLGTLNEPGSGFALFWVGLLMVRLLAGHRSTAPSGRRRRPSSRCGAHALGASVCSSSRCCSCSARLRDPRLRARDHRSCCSC